MNFHFKTTFSLGVVLRVLYQFYLRQNIRNISIENTQITWTPRDIPSKYLGLHIDTRLNWYKQTNETLSNANTRLFKLYPLIKYITLIRTIIYIPSTVWLRTSKTNSSKLPRVQNKILRITLNAP